MIQYGMFSRSGALCSAGGGAALALSCEFAPGYLVRSDNGASPRARRRRASCRCCERAARSDPASSGCFAAEAARGAPLPKPEGGSGRADGFIMGSSPILNHHSLVLRAVCCSSCINMAAT